ncbi:hypothetical protein PH7735_00805 [Shimia thalassica]|uniref:Uncharacterized protein n=1 Tax=Shimia thalassica TaxID=1715693 RepID=A0A0P1I379_9RHOB|nr:hypothetical protein PH7735_00805 [Shimia thalassica]
MTPQKKQVALNPRDLQSVTEKRTDPFTTTF